MKQTAYLFFYGYIGLVLVAGFWGAFLGADFDQQLLFGLDTAELERDTRVNLLSQYRFLRALELGYGIYAIAFRREIFSQVRHNRLFLTIMGAGVLARIVGLVDDGSPSTLFYFFLAFEAVGVMVIYTYFQMNQEAGLPQLEFQLNND